MQKELNYRIFITNFEYEEYFYFLNFFAAREILQIQSYKYLFLPIERYGKRKQTLCIVYDTSFDNENFHNILNKFCRIQTQCSDDDQMELPGGVITEEEIEKIIKGLKMEKACGPDKIPK